MAPSQLSEWYRLKSSLTNILTFRRGEIYGVIQGTNGLPNSSEVYVLILKRALRECMTGLWTSSLCRPRLKWGYQPSAVPTSSSNRFCCPWNNFHTVTLMSAEALLS